MFGPRKHAQVKGNWWFQELGKHSQVGEKVGPGAQEVCQVRVKVGSEGLATCRKATNLQTTESYRVL